MEMSRLQVDVDRDVFARTKAMAALNELTLSKYVNSILRERTEIDEALIFVDGQRMNEAHRKEGKRQNK
jgi:Arc/MetJ family transcription regulator